MARPNQITPESLIPLIRSRGPISATELAALLRVNRTTIARTLPGLGEDLVTLGATRSTRYLLRRGIRNIGSQWPVYRIDETGRAHLRAELEALHDRAWRINWASAAPAWAAHFTEPNGLWTGFPFFLSDARPQGFLGRNIALQVADLLRLPRDLRDWNDDETLVYLQASGTDLPGNLVLGDDCLRRALSRSPDLPAAIVTAESDRASAYPLQATTISQNLPVSSAGGEQPKFLTTLRTPESHRPVLVKFTAPLDQPAAIRWGDLLLCEWHAHEILAEAGLTNPGARILDAGGRRFLEVPRFDRTAVGGRLGVVSLEALASASLGLPRNWIEAADGLHAASLIEETSASIIRRLHAFGELIGNTDMHFGNLAFFMDDGAFFRVTPAYDMLPMLWAPGPQGEIIARHFAPAPPIPALEEPWRDAAALAEAFWLRVISDDRFTLNFRTISENSLETVRRLRRHID